jgi:acyl carrier protein
MFRKIVVAALVASAAAFAPTNFVGRRAAPALFMADSVEDKVKDIIVSQLGVDADKVVPAATFVDDLGADSLDTVELIMAIEEEFDCEIPEEKAAEISTVQQVCVMLMVFDGEFSRPMLIHEIYIFGAHKFTFLSFVQVIDYVAAL